MIKFVYFDVGGVVVKDFSKTNKWEDFMVSIGVDRQDFDRFDTYWESLEVSVMDDMQSIVPEINKEFGLKLSSDHDLLSEFTSRFEKNESIWPIISKIKEDYKIGLLTDQYPGMLDALYQRGVMPDIEFDVVIDSSIEKLRKPQKEIYELAEKRSNCSGYEILFIDNSESKLIVPRDMGWKVLLYDPSNIKDSNKMLLRKVSEK